MKTLTKLLLVAMLLLLPCVQAEASAKTWVNVSQAFKTTELKDFKTAEGMCVDPKDNAIYTIQKKSGEETCALFKNGVQVKNAFNGKDTTTLIGHGNDITYYNDHLYIADYSTAKVHRMKRSGSAYVYEKTYTLPGYSRVWNIETYKRTKINGDEKQLFILGTGPVNNNKTKLKFVIAWFDNTSNNFHEVGSFVVDNPNSNVLQGIAYNQETGWLHIGLSTATQGKNNIVSIKVTHVSGSKTYSTGDQVIRTYNGPDNNKYEIESIGIAPDGKFYVLVNCTGCQDPVYHIKTQ